MDNEAFDYTTLGDPTNYSPSTHAGQNVEFKSSFRRTEFGDDYVLLDVVGRGGMGIVYQAHQKSVNRSVALKMIQSGGAASDEELGRF